MVERKRVADLLRRRLLRLARERRAIAMIEFALLAPIFLLFLIGFAEIGLMAFHQIKLESAVHEVTRLIRLSPEELDEAQVRDVFCRSLSGEAGCDPRRPTTLFVAPTRNLSRELRRGADLASDSISLGRTNDNIVVVGAMQWRPLAPFFWSSVSSDGAPRLVATHLGRRQRLNAILDEDDDA